MQRSILVAALLAACVGAAPNPIVIVNPNIGNPLGDVEDFWGDDVRITESIWDHAHPSLTATPNGNLFVAVEKLTTGWIAVYRSLDGGQTWNSPFAFLHGDRVVNPSIHYVEGGDDWIVVAYTSHYGDNKLVGTLRLDPADPENYSFLSIEADITGTEEIHPHICSDNIDYGGYYLYAVYSLDLGDYFAVMFSRSLDYGDTWETPQNITDGSENSGWLGRPHLAYSDDVVHVAFEKPGWNGDGWTTQVWTTKSDNYGSPGTWTDAIQLTDVDPSAYHPTIVAEHDGDHVVVGFVREYASDTDVQFVYSTNDGDSFSSLYSLPWTFGDEYAVDLAVSESQGRYHAVYQRNTDTETQVLYCWAPSDDPVNWSATRVVNDTGTASATYPGVAVCSDPTVAPAQQAGVAWTDYRSTYYDVYFDAGFVVPVGDLNCDGVVDFDDIQPFVRALAGEEEYLSYYPDCIWLNADCDQDGDVDFDDIAAFLDLLT